MQIRLTKLNNEVIVMKKIFTVLFVTLIASGCKPLDNQLKRQGQNAVEASLKDPSSAEFRNVKFVLKSEAHLQKEGFVCGEVNGKNGFGAYDGYQKFAILVRAKTLYYIPFFGIQHEELSPLFVNSLDPESLSDIEQICKF